MTEGQKNEDMANSHDLLNELAGILPGSPLAELRNQRAEIARHIQGSYDTLLEPEQETGLSRIERGLAALRAAVLENSIPLADHYRAYLAALDVSPQTIEAAESNTLDNRLSPRQAAILRHVDRLTNEPHTATPEHLVALQTHGLSSADVVTLAQLVAFLSFQIRALAGLQLMMGEK